ncbi:serine hydrolase [Winogradskyella sp. 3972H.M.0a.05]|uniref:serine hydrolase n=1 Tax=Winogradskyella sp. 3972H.M.0a.05 TaxID=2950277 RepID=UPI003396797E
MNKIYLLALALVFCAKSFSQTTIERLEADLQNTLNEIVETYQIPGITLAVNFDYERGVNLASGYSDKEEKMKMSPEVRMPSGSVGKMFVSAIALQLIDQGKLSLDDKIEQYLGDKSWFNELPNAKDISIKNLMNHTSGLPRYIFQPEFMSDIKSNPLKDRSPEDCIAFVLNKPAAHPVNQGWAYSDTNYIVLGLVIEKVSGTAYNQQLKDKLISKLGLRLTSVQNKRSFSNLSQGYIGPQNYFGLPAKMVKDGKLEINPSFEWTGGGIVTNVKDLTKFTKALHESSILSSKSKEMLTTPINMATGQPLDQGYGLGSFIWSKRNDTRYGHSGFFPGYLSHVEYSSKHQYALAIQVNTDQGYPLLQQYVHLIDEVISKYLDELDEAKIQENFKAQENCWNNADIECYMEAYATTELIQTASRGGITFGYDNIIGDYKKYFPKERMGKLHFDNFNYRRLAGDLYFVTGRFNLKFPNRDELSRGWFSVVMKRINGEWKMITDHSS